MQCTALPIVGPEIKQWNVDSSYSNTGTNTKVISINADCCSGTDGMKTICTGDKKFVTSASAHVTQIQK